MKDCDYSLQEIRYTFERDMTTFSNESTLTEYITHVPEAVLPSKPFYAEDMVTTILEKYIPSILLVLGTVGNCLSFATFSRKTTRGSVTALLFRALAVGDTLVLISFILPDTIVLILNLNIAVTVVCKLFRCGCQAGSHFSVWVLSTIAVERFMAVTFPYKVKKWFTLTAIRCIVVFYAVGAVALAIPILMYYDATIKYGQVICTVSKANQSNLYMRYIISWIFTVLYSFLPFLTLLFCSMAIIYQVAHARVKRQQMASVNDPSKQASNNNMTVILLIISFAFLILSTPSGVFLIYRRVSLGISHSPAYIAKVRLVQVIFAIMMYLNHSLNFVFYCISGTRFRQELIIMLTCHKHTPALGITTMTEPSISTTTKN